MSNKAKTQAEVIKSIAGTTGLSEAKVKEVLNAQSELASAEIKSSGSFILSGIGKLKSKDVPARQGRNPKTGETMTIKASRRVSVSLNKAFKDGVQ